MIARKASRLVLVLAFCVLPSFASQAQTTGRIAGTVKDQNGALIVGAEVKTVNVATGERRRVKTDESGAYSIPFLSPGRYQVIASATNFATISLQALVVITETTPLDITLPVGAMMVEPDFTFLANPLMQTDGPQLGRAVDARTVSELPLATRNFTQILGLSPGTSVYLPDNTVVGRNSQNVSVNGARVTQNNFQINGVDANAGVVRGTGFANPAPETIQEFKVQTSLYDATFGRAGGGDIQIATRSGTNDFHGV